MRTLAIVTGLIGLIAISCTGGRQAEDQWHHPLYMANQDYWRARITVEIYNSSVRDLFGEPVPIEIGDGIGQLPLTGVEAGGIRAVDSQGTELLWRITTPVGKIITRGSIPGGGELVLPATLAASTSETYFIYYDNPSAWPIADVLESHHGVTNGGFEKEEDGNPAGWRMDWASGDRNVQWSREQAYSGEYCIHVLVTGKGGDEVYGVRQRDIYIRGGTRYRVEGWIKANNIEGGAGWRILIGDKVSYDNDFTSHEETLTGGDGTYDWKQVSAEFTAPENANSARVYTILNGTGDAWFDEIKITCLDEVITVTEIKSVRTLTLNQTGDAEEWPEEKDWDIRVPIKNINIGNRAIDDLPVYVDMEQILARLHDKINKSTTMRLEENGYRKPYFKYEKALLFDGHVPAQSVQTVYAYFAGNGDLDPDNPETDYYRWVNDKRNLVRNPDISNGEANWNRLLRDNLPGNADQGIEETGNPDDQCLSLRIRAEDTFKKIGWIQDIQVTPGKSYMYSSLVKCTDIVPGGYANIRVEFQSTDGVVLERDSSNTTQGTRDWTALSGIGMAPEDAAVAQIQLTLASPGTVWYDGVCMMEVIEGTASSMFFDQREAAELDELTAWQVNPVKKVFYEDLPPDEISRAKISAARNETEPLQIAFRSPTAHEQVRIEITAPTGPGGQTLDQVTTSVVGYVPINYPSNYFRTEVPYWHLKYPDGEIGSDGWTGFWPDPLLPVATFDLAAHTTQPVWIEVKVPENAATGDYTGMIQLYENEVLMKEIPWTVHVWDFSLPRELPFGAIFDFRYPDHLRDPGPDQFRNDLSRNEFRDQYWLMMAEHGINGGEIFPKPVIEYKDGQVIADFSEYDKAASYYFDELNLPFAYAPTETFYLFGWSYPPDNKFGEQPYPGTHPYEDADRSELLPGFKQAYQSVLRTYWDHMKSKGWADRIILYIADEPYQSEDLKVDIGAQVQALCEMIREVDENIPIYTSTWWYHPEWSDYIDVWGLTTFGVSWGKQPVPPEDLQEVIKKGNRIWFTTDGQMCTETPYLAVERLLPYYAYKYGAEAYEFWGINWITFNPYEYGWQSYIFQSQAPGEAFWIRYPNGDGYLIYPGKPIGHDGPVASIRLKQVREGITDYTYLAMLEELIQKGNADDQLIESAKQTLDKALDLVEIPSEIVTTDPIEIQIFNGRYSTRLLKDPDDVLRVREQVAVHIEKLVNN